MAGLKNYLTNEAKRLVQKDMPFRREIMKLVSSMHPGEGNTSHTHTSDDITDFPEALQNYLISLPGYGPGKILGSNLTWIDGNISSTTTTTITEIGTTTTTTTPAPTTTTTTSTTQGSTTTTTSTTGSSTTTTTTTVAQEILVGEIPYDPSLDAYMLQSGTNNMTWMKNGSTDNYIGNFDERLEFQHTYIDLSRFNAKVTHIEAIDGSGSYGSPTQFYLVHQDGSETFLGEVDSFGYMNTIQMPGIALAPTSAKFIRIYGYKREFPVEIRVYGQYTLPAAPSLARHATPFREKTGVNTFVWNYYSNGEFETINESKMSVINSFGCIRDYLDWNRLESVEGEYSFNKTQSGNFNLDNMYARLNAEGIEPLVCVKTLPDYMLNSWDPAERDNENVPVMWNTDLLTTVASFSNPESYIYGGKMAFQFAARYGSNTELDPALVSVWQPGGWNSNEVKIGLNYVRYFEVENERDKWWKERKAYQTAFEYAAMMSAYYDGHKGALGDNVGIKTADPNMKVVIGGLALPDAAYIHAIVNWCQLNRGYNENGTVNLCWDVINYHEYANDGTSSQSGTPTRGKAPELVSYISVDINKFNTISAMYSQSMPVWNTEVGYDINQGSPQKAMIIGSKTAQQVQADWLLRTALLHGKYGIERGFIYMLPDAGGGSGRFATSGVWDEPNGWSATPRPAANFMKQANSIIGYHIFDSEVNADPMIHKYTKENVNTVYVCWIPDEIGRTGNYVLLLPGNPMIKVHTLNYDTQTASVQNIQVTGNTYTVACSETPVFVEVL